MMLRGVLTSGYDERRLRWLLALLFLALAAPTGAVLWQAYGQLKWEAFHQARSQAEELTTRIDRDIAEGVAIAEARSFAEYAFLNISGDPGAGFLQRSPLSAIPVVQDLPGVIGYFQVDAEGRFTTPLLPESGERVEALGVNESDYGQREALADRIRKNLVGNQLVEDRDTAEPATQEFFDRLNQRAVSADEAEFEAGQERRQTMANAPQEQKISKVKDLKLDDAYQQKSEMAEEQDMLMELGAQAPQAPPSDNRARRTEQATLPEPVVPERSHLADEAGAREINITTFESEVDPYELAMLASGEFVLFRKVWRDGARYVQGMLINRDAFVDQAVLAPFRATTLSAMSNLVVGFGDDVISFANAGGEGNYSDVAPGMEGDLLFRSRLSSPLDSLELIFSINRLPAGPGASVLGWTTFLLAAVFGLGFLALYRLGLGQIRLARQQQDFVSSVSHELKTPLTSIRMYSEMLKEGWADEAKRAQYYDFIHDESERLSRLISNVLQLASITRNEPSFELQVVSVAGLLDRVRSKITEQVRRAGFELSFEVDEASAGKEVEVDEDCMMQIVINLVDNAIKFSHEAETKRLEVTAAATSDGQVRFAFRDFGPGIPREQIRKIFRLFYRPESELTRETVGTGIGLAIVHQLTVAMGGKVDVLNREPGAEFGITFPQSS